MISATLNLILRVSTLTTIVSILTFKTIEFIIDKLTCKIRKEVNKS